MLLLAEEYGLHSGWPYIYCRGSAVTDYLAIISTRGFQDKPLAKKEFRLRIAAFVSLTVDVSLAGNVSRRFFLRE
jgi:hypothetical protein